MKKKQGNHQPTLHWTITPWAMNGQGSWKQQPVILVEGREPFFANHPNDYIVKLEELHNDPIVQRGTFYASIGQLKDALEQVWDAKEVVLWQGKQ